jgi:hypothetical protein
VLLDELAGRPRPASGVESTAHHDGVVALQRARLVDWLDGDVEARLLEHAADPFGDALRSAQLGP